MRTIPKWTDKIHDADRIEQWCVFIHYIRVKRL